MPFKKNLSRQFVLEFVFLAVIFCFFLRIILDPDIGWHLRVGEYIFQNKNIPRTDLFSFSLPNYPYIYHSWLSDLLLYFTYERLGLIGINFIYSSVLSCCFWLVARTSRLRVKENWIYLFLIFVSPIVFFATYLRVQLFTLLGLAAVYYIYRKNLSRQTGLIYLLPSIFALWSNLHGGFFLGLLFYLALLLSEVLVFLFKHIFPFKIVGEPGVRLNYKQFSRLFGLFLVSLFSALINPYGWKAYQIALTMGTNQFSSKFNLDWAPLVRQNNYSFINAAFLFIGIVSVYLIKNRLEIREKLMLAIFFLLSLKLNRFSLPLLVVLLPGLIYLLADLGRKISAVIAKLKLGLIIFFIFWLFVYLVETGFFIKDTIHAYQDEEFYASMLGFPYYYPYKAVQYIKDNPVPQRLFNDFNWGGYLTWKLPDRKFFIDGRMDNFFVDGRSFGEIYWEISNLGEDWQKLMKEYRIEAVLIPKISPLAQALRLMPEWELLYEDDNSLIMQKNNQ